jgi:hypothetical protein
MNNRYLIYLGRERGTISWTPPDPHPIDGDLTYLGRVFEVIEQSLKVRGLTFYLTWEHVGLNELPSYGPDVVVILANDEWCRIPAYFDKVGAIFKWYGTNPIFGCELKLSYLTLLTATQYARMFVKRLPGLIRYGHWSLRSILSNRRSQPAIFAIPLGYNKGQLDLPIVPIQRRKYDVFFAGSVAHYEFSKYSLRNLFGNPKELSRKQMISQLERFKRRHPHFNVKLTLTPGFWASEAAASDFYSEEMMNAKICVVPRGTSFETFRFFEALRYGCVLITEALPPRWFYDGSPAIRIANWGRLEEELTRLLRDEELMQQKHDAALQWWRDRCSEAAVGTYIAETVSNLGVSTQPSEPLTRLPSGHVPQTSAREGRYCARAVGESDSWKLIDGRDCQRPQL